MKVQVTDTLSRSLNSAESISGQLLPRSGKPADQKCHNRSSQHSSPEDPVKDTEGTIAYARLTDANTDPNIEGGEKKGTLIMTSTLLATSIKLFTTWSLKSLWKWDLKKEILKRKFWEYIFPSWRLVLIYLVGRSCLFLKHLGITNL